MNRIFFSLCAVLLVACNSTPPAGFVFPQAVGGWKLEQIKDLSAGDAPEPIRRLGLTRTQSGEYVGPGRIAARVYEMTSPSGAFEAEQTWKPTADTVAFHKGKYFAVIHWEKAERTAVSTFVRQMEKQLGPRPN